MAMACLVTFAAAATCQAAGFALYEWGTKGNALAGNMTGHTDAEVVSYNPAGIAFMDKMKASAGVVAIAPSGTVSTTNMYTGKKTSQDQTDNIHPIPHVYFAGPVFKGTDLKPLYFGVGLFSRYGLSSEFDENWDGRYNSYNAEIETFSLQPTLAYRFGSDWSVAMGADIMYFNLTLESKIDATKVLAGAGALPLLRAMGLPTTINDPSTTLLDVDSRLTGKSTGVGGLLSVQYMPNNSFAVSATYRSQVEHNLHGTAEFSPSSTTRALMPNNWYTTGVTGSVTLPDSFDFGVMYRPVKTVTLGAKAIYTRWSSYDALTIDYDKPTFGVPSVSSTKDWSDVWRLSVSVQWEALSWLELRASYIYDESPVNDEYADYLLPTNDRNTFGIGAGFKFGNGWRADVNYTYLMQKDRTYENDQINKGVMAGEATDSIAHMLGLSINKEF